MDPDQTVFCGTFVAPDLGLHRLLMPVCLNSLGYYSNKRLCYIFSKVVI